MSDSLFSQHWFRISDLHPQLRSHVHLERHCYRSEIWYVVKDPISGRTHRVNSAAYHFVGRLDGRHSVQEIWDTCIGLLGDDAPSQGEIIDLLSILGDAELIQTEASPDVAQLFAKRDKRASAKVRQKLNPLAFKVNLGNPSKFLDVFVPLFSIFLRPSFALLWAGAMLLALMLMGSAWTEIQTYARLNLAKPSMLMLMWFAYPMAKLLHELGHGLAVKVWGGEVKEYGVTLLAFFPVPYVDASAASGFRSKWQRVCVSLIGLMIELALAALAFVLWSNVSDGLLREFCFAVMFTCTVSSLLVNGNPLMRFDAYFALCDFLESPGLGQRSNAMLLHSCKRVVLGMKSAVAPAVASGERPWLYVYGILALIYRCVASVAMATWIAGYSFMLGVLFSAWVAMTLVVKPIWNFLSFLLTSASLVRQRARALLGTTFVSALCIGFVGWFPVPHSTQSEGVVWTPEQARIRTQVDGFVKSVLGRDQAVVAIGDPILQLEDPVLRSDLERAAARLDALQAAHQLALSKSSSETAALQDDIQRVELEIVRLNEKIELLTVRSEVAGRLALLRADDLPGSYVAKGALVGHVLTSGNTVVRAVLSQSDVSLVRNQIQSVSVRLAEQSLSPKTAVVINQTPASSRELPSPALGGKGGGSFATDPNDENGVRLQVPVFVLDVELQEEPLRRIGGRAWVRFDHGSASLASQWARGIQQIFLKYRANDSV
jgi:putative peptide zinc metalloprotease protein